jgi:hypothetical protein
MAFYKIGSYYIPENQIQYITELTEGKVKTYLIVFGGGEKIKVSASVAEELGIKEVSHGKAEQATEGRKTRGKKAK